MTVNEMKRHENSMIMGDYRVGGHRNHNMYLLSSEDSRQVNHLSANSQKILPPITAQRQPYQQMALNIQVQDGAQIDMRQKPHRLLRNKKTGDSSDMSESILK